MSRPLRATSESEPTLWRESGPQVEHSRRSGTREQLLRVATELFSRKGFDGVSIRDVALAAQATLPSIYHHFGDKRRLYMEVCLDLFGSWGTYHDALLERHGSPAQRLFDYFVSVGNSLVRDKKFSTLLQREILERDIAGIRELTEATFRGHFEQVTSLCRALGCRGDVGSTAHTLFALVFGLAQLRPIAQALDVAQRLESSEAMARHALAVVLPDVDWSDVRYGGSPMTGESPEVADAPSGKSRQTTSRTKNRQGRAGPSKRPA
jgi:AcrR family transcriptional regulator